MCGIPCGSNFWVLLVWMQRRYSRHRVSGIHSCFMIGVVVESWMFAISRPAVVSHSSSEICMLNMPALEKAFADGRWSDNNFLGTRGQDPCSDG